MWISCCIYTEPMCPVVPVCWVCDSHRRMESGDIFALLFARKTGLKSICTETPKHPFFSNRGDYAHSCSEKYPLFLKCGLLRGVNLTPPFSAKIITWMVTHGHFQNPKQAWVPRGNMQWLDRENRPVAALGNLLSVGFLGHSRNGSVTSFETEMLGIFSTMSRPRNKALKIPAPNCIQHAESRK